MGRAVEAYAAKARVGEALGWPRAALTGWATSTHAAYTGGAWTLAVEAGQRAVPSADALAEGHLAASVLGLVAGSWRRLGRPEDALAAVTDDERRWRALGEDGEAVEMAVLRADVLLD